MSTDLLLRCLDSLARLARAGDTEALEYVASLADAAAEPVLEELDPMPEPDPAEGEQPIETLTFVLGQISGRYGREMSLTILSRFKATSVTQLAPEKVPNAVHLARRVWDEGPSVLNEE